MRFFLEGEREGIICFDGEGKADSMEKVAEVIKMCLIYLEGKLAYFGGTCTYNFSAPQ